MRFIVVILLEVRGVLAARAAKINGPLQRPVQALFGRPEALETRVETLNRGG